MKTKFIIWLFVIATLKYYAGCNDGYLTWRLMKAPMSAIKIESTVNLQTIILQSNVNDSVLITCYSTKLCGSWKLISAYKNNELFNLIEGGCGNVKCFRFGCFDGEYIFYFEGGYTQTNYKIVFSIHPLNVVGDIELISNTNFLSVYPNPTSKQISISHTTKQILEINLINNIGQTVLTTNPNNNETNFDVEELPRGIYYLTAVLEDKKRLTKKIIIE